jgi:hypothetical protein
MITVLAVDANPTQQHRKALAERLDLSEEQVQVRPSGPKCQLLAAQHSTMQRSALQPAQCNSMQACCIAQSDCLMAYCWWQVLKGCEKTPCSYRHCVWDLSTRAGTL